MLLQRIHGPLNTEVAYNKDIMLGDRPIYVSMTICHVYEGPQQFPKYKAHFKNA